MELVLDKKKRSTLITLGTVGLGYAAFRTVPLLIPEKLVLEPLNSPIGFRKYVAGEISSGFDLFVGLDTPDSPEVLARKEAAFERVSEDVCSSLYRGLSPTGNQVPMASFSDYYCPFCRVQTKRLGEMVDAMPEAVSVAWHELPLLGDNSNLAAKAALAAKRQGAYVAFHDQLMKSPFVASDEYLQRLSRELNVNFDQLQVDMKSAEIATELEESAALARVFSFIGTPALVIGRTVVQGQVSDNMIGKIIALEREEGWEAACKKA